MSYDLETALPISVEIHHNAAPDYPVNSYPMPTSANQAIADTITLPVLNYGIGEVCRLYVAANAAAPAPVRVQVDLFVTDKDGGTTDWLGQATPSTVVNPGDSIFLMLSGASGSHGTDLSYNTGTGGIDSAAGGAYSIVAMVVLQLVPPA